MFGRLQQHIFLGRRLLESTRLQHIRKSVWSPGKVQPSGSNVCQAAASVFPFPAIARLILFGNIPFHISNSCVEGSRNCASGLIKAMNGEFLLINGQLPGPEGRRNRSGKNGAQYRSTVLWNFLCPRIICSDYDGGSRLLETTNQKKLSRIPNADFEIISWNCCWITEWYW